MKIFVFLIIIALQLLTGGCDENPTYEPYNDEQALIDIVSIDYPSIFETILINTDIPDTTLLLQTSDYQALYFWREIVGSSVQYNIDATYPDTLNAIPYATVNVLDSIRINFQAIVRDTTADPDTLVRITQSTVELAHVAGKMEKWGDQYDSRNGWILREVTCTRGYGFSAYNPIVSVDLYSLGTGEVTVYKSDITGFRAINQILNAAANDKIIVTTEILNHNDVVTYHFGKNSFEIVETEYVGDNKYQAEITTPAISGYFHLTVDVLKGSTLTEGAGYQFERWSILLYIP